MLSKKHSSELLAIVDRVNQLLNDMEFLNMAIEQMDDPNVSERMRTRVQMLIECFRDNADHNLLGILDTAEALRAKLIDSDRAMK